jgi:hypothetical protein
VNDNSGRKVASIYTGKGLVGKWSGQCGCSSSSVASLISRSMYPDLAERSLVS